MSEQYFFMIVCFTAASEGSSQLTAIDWANNCSRPYGPSKRPCGPVKPRLAREAAYTARIPVIPGEKPFHCDTGSACTHVSEMLSTVAMAIAIATAVTESSKSLPAPAAAEV